MAGEGWQMGLQSIGQPSRSSEVECNPKMSILGFLAGERWQMGFQSIDQPGQSPEVERNLKMSILFFRLERVHAWGLSPSTNLADHQKLHVVKNEYLFFDGRGEADRVRVYQPARPIFRS